MAFLEHFLVKKPFWMVFLPIWDCRSAFRSIFNLIQAYLRVDMAFSEHFRYILGPFWSPEAFFGTFLGLFSGPILWSVGPFRPVNYIFFITVHVYYNLRFQD